MGIIPLHRALRVLIESKDVEALWKLKLLFRCVGL